MLELIRNNLPALMPIFVLSFISVIIMIERFFYFYSIKEDNEVTRRSGSLYAQGKNEQALEALGTAHNSAERAVLRYAIENRFLLDDVLRQRLEIIAGNRITLMENRVSFLAAIANIATLIGLLGTIVGMIVAFNAIYRAGSSNPYLLAGGIGQALITTAAGLATAIPNLLAYHYFAEVIGRKVDRLNNLIAEILSSKGSRL
ncbi:MAG: MotA/TolQ/ExbB proton channel family protein [Spirochaetaceae bacterium]|nr:MotA/TolQ/ExbB proton channel family protein [Spirochaetaceae bacterium]